MSVGFEAHVKVPLKIAQKQTTDALMGILNHYEKTQNLIEQ